MVRIAGLVPLLLALLCAPAPVRAEWQQLTHGGLKFMIPAEWGVLKAREFEGQWGIRDDDKREGVGFSIARERHPERDLEKAARDGLTVVSLGETDFGGVTAEQHEISGEAEGVKVFIRLAWLSGLLPDGDRVAFSAAAVEYPREAVQGVIEQVMASVRPTGELIETLTGYSRHVLLDGLIDLEVRNNWRTSDVGDSVSWEPPLFSLYGASLIGFAKGYALTGSNGLLSKLQDPVIERGDLFGIPGWRISGTGVAVAYVGPMRSKTVPATTRVFLSDVCLDKGDRFGYVVTATEEQLGEHQEALQRLLDSVSVTLPAAAGPCDEPVRYTWRKGLTIDVPRSWRKNQDSEFHLSWYDRVITTGANITLYISHGAAAQHPLIGEGYAPVDTLGPVHVDGYPATHYRKRVTGSDRVEAVYDYYVLDTRMRLEREGRRGDDAYLYFQFSTSPSDVAEPDLAMQRALLATVRLDDAWVSETPVVRAPVGTTESAAVAGKSPSAGAAAAPAEGPVVVDGAGPDTAVAADDVKTPEAAVRPAPPEPGQGAPVAGAAQSAQTKPDRADYERARALREEGASLQRQGRLGEAVARYRESLALYPDDRLEAHVRRIEAMLGDMGDK